ncbi:MAG: ABC transporter ATP-binding protein [Proteobacteria bacterium]|nr:ABC transporter ATP-binding protein [Pseudomonadota bacterium]
MALLEVSNITVQQGDRAVLKQVSFSLDSGELVAMVGPNGAGKTTVLRSILGLVRPTAGAVYLLDGEIEKYSPRERARLIGYVPQRVSVVFPYSVRQFLEMSLYPVAGTSSFPHSRCTAIEESLEITQVANLATRELTELSGGELQRVMLASALVQKPKIVLLDEPASSLDPKHAQLLYQLLWQLVSERGLAVLMVTHDINSAIRCSTRVLALKHGTFGFDGAPQEFLQEGILEQLYEASFERIKRADELGVVVVPKISV